MIDNSTNGQAATLKPLVVGSNPSAASSFCPFLYFGTHAPSTLQSTCPMGFVGVLTKSWSGYREFSYLTSGEPQATTSRIRISTAITIPRSIHLTSFHFIRAPQLRVAVTP